MPAVSEMNSVYSGLFCLSMVPSATATTASPVTVIISISVKPKYAFDCLKQRIDLYNNHHQHNN